MDSKNFLKPTPTERLLNRLLGVVAGLGVGPGYLHLLQVAGRKTGRLYRTPVNLMDVAGVTYLVAPRGDTQWVRNARKAPTIHLKRGRQLKEYRVREVGEERKPDLLKEYLERYAAQVQQYFSVEAGSPVESYIPVSQSYPVFELEEVISQDQA